MCEGEEDGRWLGGEKCVTLKPLGGTGRKRMGDCAVGVKGKNRNRKSSLHKRIVALLTYRQA